MRAFLFSIFYGFTWLIAQIPSKAIYVISDFTYIMVYHVARYRKAVVRNNLTISFPEKSISEIKIIEKKFYSHLCDLIYENIFLLHASRERALRRCKFSNLDILEKYYAQGKSAVMATGHYGNWELFALMGDTTKHIPVGIFKPLANKRFEKLMNDARERFGGVPVAMKDTLRAVINYKREGIPILLGLISDQTPAKSDIRYWTTFLNHDTPVFLGVEKIAEKFDMPVFFTSMRKTKRGKYEVYFKLLTENPKDLKPYELTEMHVRELEKIIRDKPEYWLWSHRRWKRKRKATEPPTNL
jgi:KDO2-lipid IV(A) lauroyltransferase